MDGLILVFFYLIGILAFIIGLGFYADKKKREEREWFHQTMERIADNEEKKRGKE